MFTIVVLTPPTLPDQAAVPTDLSRWPDGRCQLLLGPWRPRDEPLSRAADPATARHFAGKSPLASWPIASCRVCFEVQSLQHSVTCLPPATMNAHCSDPSAACLGQRGGGRQRRRQARSPLPAPSLSAVPVLAPRSAWRRCPVSHMVVATLTSSRDSGCRRCTRGACRLTVSRGPGMCNGGC